MNDITAALRASGAIAILRLTDHTHAVAAGRAVHDAGLPALEVTLDHPDALDSLRALRAELPPAALVGAGSVRTPQHVEQAAASGASYCVSPHTDTTLIRAALDAGLEPLPGATTPTEISVALDAGARLVKLFPAGPLGLGYLRALRGPFRDIALVPTGGIRHDAVADWLDAGAVAVGLGSDLVPAAPTESELPGVSERAGAVAAQVTRWRATLQ